MNVRPNVVVGLVGVVVFILTASYIFSNWRELTGTNAYDATVETHRMPFGERVMSAASGSTTRLPYDVPTGNITHVITRVTWEESTLPLAGQHGVTLSILRPNGALVAQTDRITGGRVGISLEKELRYLPAAQRFSATDTNVDEEFHSRYPAHPEDAGTWTLVLSADSPSNSGSLEYRVDFEVVSYTAAFEQETPAVHIIPVRAL